MGRIHEAIQDFCRRRLSVYEADPNQAVRDARGAEAVALDHGGRWQFELIQNSEDAKAHHVLVRFVDDVIYFCDDGHGLKPEAIESLSGTHFSIKREGIGRKGIGFKAVFTISRSPQVFSGNEGVLYDRDQANALLIENGIELEPTRVPFQWLPIFRSRTAAAESDAVLATLEAFATVVKLPMRSAETRDAAREHLCRLPALVLLPFTSVKRITLETNDPSNSSETNDPPVVLDIDRPRGDDGVATLTDTRAKPAQTRWHIRRSTVRAPGEALKVIDDAEDQRRASEATLLVAAPVSGDQPVPSEDDLPLFVFYPTEDASPVRLLLHGEFFVKSDRTRVLPLGEHAYNIWLAQALAELVLKFVNDAFRASNPAAYLHLLDPRPNLDEHLTAKHLWNLIRAAARRQLRLPGTDGAATLRVDNVCFIGTSVAWAKARTVVESQPDRLKLVHDSIDEDKVARRVLCALGCREIDDNGVVELIAQLEANGVRNSDVVLAAWEWLARWRYDRLTHLTERAPRIRALPIIPIDGELKSRAGLAGSIVTWREDVANDDLPEWLPLRLVDDWFRDAVLALDEKSSVRRLLTQLEITEPSFDVAQRALSQAIDAFWKNQQGSPRRFLDLIKACGWHQRVSVPNGLARCPILALMQGADTPRWVPACSAYFGADWGNVDLAHIYRDASGIHWAQRPRHDAEAMRALLLWLGVRDHPRLVVAPENRVDRTAYDARIAGALSPYTSRGPTPKPLVLDRIDPGNLDVDDALRLLVILIDGWNAYASRRGEQVSYRPRYYREVDAQWWHEIRKALRPPLIAAFEPHPPLEECWRPDRETKAAVGSLLPIIDLSSLDDETQKKIEAWLADEVRVLRHLTDITAEQWEALLGTRIPAVMPRSRLSKESDRRAVQGWYEAALRSLVDQEVSASLPRVPLMCRKGDVWNYVSDGDRWLADDVQIADAFRDDLWQVPLRASSYEAAKQYLGVKSIRDSAKVEINVAATADATLVDLCRVSQLTLDDAKPYVYALRCNRTSKDYERLRMRLQKVKLGIVDEIFAELRLAGMFRSIERDYAVEGDRLLIRRAAVNKMTLAQALAEFLHVSAEADLYENLLRCANNVERARKLEACDIPRDQIDSAIAEYRTGPVEPEIESVPASSPADQKEDPMQGVAVRPAGYRGDVTAPPRAPSGLEDPPATPAAPSGGNEDDVPLALKNIDGSNIDWSTPWRAGGVSGAPRPGHGTGGGSPTAPLSTAQTKQLEQRGREVAARLLERWGYNVEFMSFGNKGFDLKAVKDGRELLVEVKAHLACPRVVDLTAPQLRECYRALADADGAQWEFWNVANLASNQDAPIHISRYREFPDEAISGRAWRVDLGLCRPLEDDAGA